MLAGIGQCFLHDAVKGVLQNRWKALKLHVAIEFDIRASVSPLFVNQMRDCRLKPDLIDDRWPYFADQAACLSMGLA
jgi:hypothetical protein